MFCRAILFFSFTAVLLSGCRNSSSNNDYNANPLAREEAEKCTQTPVQNSGDHRYIFSARHNGDSCTTGCQIFSTQQDYCEGLLSEELNRHCAESQRREAFRKSCQ